MQTLLRKLFWIPFCFAGMLVSGQMPNFATRQEKEAWIAAHPAEYKAMNTDVSKPSTDAPVVSPQNAKGANSTPGKVADPVPAMDYSKTGGAPAPLPVEKFFGMGIGADHPRVEGIDPETGQVIPTEEAQSLYQLRLKHWMFIYQPVEFEQKYGRYTGPVPGGLTAEEYRKSLKKSHLEDALNNDTHSGN